MTTRQDIPQVSTQEARDDFARLVRDAEYGQQTLITRHGKPVAKVVPADASGSLDPARVDRALRAVVARLDYDLHKAIECDEETGDDTYGEVANAFIAAYEEAQS